MELIIYLIIIGIALVVLFYGSVFFVAGLAYGYWGLSIGMAPVVWIILIIGMLVGLICAVKNALKAAKKINSKGGSL